MRRVIDLTLLGLLLVLPGHMAESARRPIQNQGSSPYCLFAVNAYLAGGDMWRLEVEYHRQALPTSDGITPINSHVMALARQVYGAQWHVWPRGDWWAARWGVLQGHPTAFTGQGHALVVLDLQGGQVFYLDSLHPDQVQTMSEAKLRQWWDGWAWYNKRH